MFACLVLGAALLLCRFAGQPDLSLERERAASDAGHEAQAGIAEEGVADSIPEATRRTGRQDESEETAEVPAVRDGRAVLQLQTRWSDGTVAADIALKVVPAEGPSLEVRTDSEGIALVKNLEPGRAILVVDRGMTERVALPPSAVTSHTIQLPVRRTVSGVVVNWLGERVPHAEIWISHSFDYVQGFMTATCDAAGEFQVRGLHESACLSARARDYSPSPFVAVSHLAATTPKLVLPSVGGAVEGVVRRPDEFPLVGATLTIGRKGAEMLEDGWQASRFRQRVPDDGQVRIEGLAPGTYPVYVDCPGCARWVGEVEVRDRATARFTAHLVPCAVVSGTVRKRDGEPAAGAFIRFSSESFEAAVDSEDDGRFRIEVPTKGVVRLAAGKSGVGYTATSLEVSSGESHVWNPVLDELVTVYAKDDNHEALIGWAIRHHNGGRRILSDQQGRWRVDPAEYSGAAVAIYAPDCEIIVYEADLDFGGGESVEVVVPKALWPSAWFVGKVDMDQGLSGTVSRIGGSFSEQRFRVEAGAEFQIGPVPAGDYQIRFSADGLEDHVERRHLKEGERCVLGLVWLDR